MRHLCRHHRCRHLERTAESSKRWREGRTNRVMDGVGPFGGARVRERRRTALHPPLNTVPTCLFHTVYIGHGWMLCRVALTAFLLTVILHASLIASYPKREELAHPIPAALASFSVARGPSGLLLTSLVTCDAQTLSREHLEGPYVDVLPSLQSQESEQCIKVERTERPPAAGKTFP